MGVYDKPNQVKPSEPPAVTLESWSQGYMVGSLVIMAGKILHEGFCIR